MAAGSHPGYRDSVWKKLRWSRIIGKVGAEFRGLLTPVSSRMTPLRRESFELWGEQYPYFVHPHNTTWRNERCVEIAVAARFIHENVPGRGMELGNVLSRYGVAAPRDVVDRYERSDDVLNVDVLEYQPESRLDYIVSVSTLEHVGWDEEPRDPEKALQAMAHLLMLLRTSGGRMLVTVPLGHNDVLDRSILGGRWQPFRQATLVRSNSRWSQTHALQWRPYRGRGGTGADAVWIAEFR